MPFIVRQRDWADGDLVSPHELNAELRAMTAIFNGGMDRDNVTSALLAKEKYALGAIHFWADYKATNAITITIPEGIHRGSWVPVAAATITLTTTEILLDIKAKLHSTLSGGDIPCERMGIFVDGELQAASGFVHATPRTFIARNAVLLTEGTHVIDMRIQGDPLTTGDFRLEHRSILLREAIR